MIFLKKRFAGRRRNKMQLQHSDYHVPYIMYIAVAYIIMTFHYKILAASKDMRLRCIWKFLQEAVMAHFKISSRNSSTMTEKIFRIPEFERGIFRDESDVVPLR
jgi:hypothetical protein